VYQGSIFFGTTLLRRTASLALVTALACLAFDAVARAAFPGRPGRIAFSAETGRFQGQNRVLWDYDPRTKVRRQLTARHGTCTRDSDWVDGGLDYSPDGRWIAYLHWNNCQPEVQNELRIMRADGSQNRLVKRVSDGIDPLSANVAFAPDGARLALWDDPSFADIADVTIVELATGTAIRSPWPAMSSERLDWSVTGRMVTPFPRGLYTGRPNGTDRRRITSPPHQGPLISYDESPEWSPSGGRITFLRKWFDNRCEDGCSVPSRTAIWTVRPGRPAVRLSRTRSAETGCPTFSPNGRQLAFIRLGRYADGPVFEAVFTTAPTGRGYPRVLMRAPSRIRALWNLAWQPLPTRR
jgi:Tol biopolymer transport system component